MKENLPPPLDSNIEEKCSQVVNNLHKQPMPLSNETTLKESWSWSQFLGSRIINVSLDAPTQQSYRFPFFSDAQFKIQSETLILESWSL